MTAITTSTDTQTHSLRLMGATVGAAPTPSQRRRAPSPYPRLANELGFAKAKTARDNVAVAYRRVAITNRVLREAGLDAKVGELMAVITASLAGDPPPLEDAIHRAQRADATEDCYEADFIRRSGDAELEAWITHLAGELHLGEVLLAALVREREARKAATT